MYIEKGSDRVGNTGKLAIAALVVIAIGTSSFSWWYRWRETHRAAEFWGPIASQLIRHPERVVATYQGPNDQQSSKDITRAPGISNLRHALSQDARFSWAATERHSRPEIDGSYSLAFHGQDRRLEIRFASDFRWLRYQLSHTGYAQAQTGVACVGPIAQGLREFLTEQFAAVGEE